MNKINYIIGITNGVLASLLFAQGVIRYLLYDAQPENIQLAALIFNSACWISLTREEDETKH